VAWARAVGEGPTRGQNRGCSYLAVTGGARRGTSSARSRRMLPHGGARRGASSAHLARRPQLRRFAPASWPAGDGIGQWEERGGRR
jgi:hypothetical protein